MNMEYEQKIADLKSLTVRRAFRDWEPFMSKYHCEVVCEIGVRTGSNFMSMIKHNPKLAVAVDCWKDDGILGRNDICLSQQELDRQYEYFKELVADKPFVKICRGYSFDVAKEFPDESFDFIFIDADHTYEGCSRDIRDWWPKIKKDGIFCGHDYQVRSVRTKNGKITFGVREAVDEFVKNNNIATFFKLHPNTWGVIK